MNSISRKRVFIFGFIAVLLILGGLAIGLYWFNDKPPSNFDGDRAMQDVAYQVTLGDRIPQSPSHAKVVAWIQAELEKAGWTAEVQEAEMMDHPIQNIVARQPDTDNSGKPWIIIGAHYDTRIYADQDPDPQNRTHYVPGANDGASGVAILLEMARSLPKNLPVRVWLVFFDAEDNGDIPGWDWLLGSQAFVSTLPGKPQSAVVIDMVGDKDLGIYMERNSNQAITLAIWAEAAKLGYKQFIDAPKYAMLDDHTPFLQAGIPAVDIIDFDYPYWHTTADTPDKVSGTSMKAVGDTLAGWLESGAK